ncbi:DeoR/GlpR family DNA-binding transcription regulator [Caldilinea sp.]|jgi:DeoR/GlpR family transcriptional regulator of sugar metabolism|uniref:DeoR/GlpR family DNA-binding transcription regulator n=1 Tax=Caldilinea sp. TaxID=2293560 RepID=UPI0026115270|nr:DeoR/GlpR family DNA-binding transcription regulator [uncultured Caldilinea sp.]
MKVIEDNRKLTDAFDDLYLAERRRAIVELVQTQGRVAVAELSQRFGVSEVTIRADLQALAEQKLLVRTHGGAVRMDNDLGEMALALRRQRQVKEKSRIGQAGAERIEEGDAVFLDSSSTSLAIAHHLKQHRYVTVVTNSLEVVHELFDAPGVDVVLVGGVLQRETASFVGAHGLEEIARLNLQKGFFGAHGVDLLAGLTDVSPDEAAVKRPIAALCRQVIAVLDATKWARVGVASFASLDQVSVIITDAGAPGEMVAAVRARGVEVAIV